MRNDLKPPGVTSNVSASNALVIAPHFDDDVLGCGGLIAQLTAAGTEVGVLFLTDGSGGEEEIEGRAAYAERRRAEAIEGLKILGVTDTELLDLEDGTLATQVDLAAEGIRRTLIKRAPDLLLAISPLEISTDHRAAFAALHAVLSPLRGGTDLDAAVADLDILLYEANHPAFPDVLVDVSNQTGLIIKAIEAHESQLERHNYRELALGLRSLRTASLPPEITAAEGYRRLAVNDFVTSSAATMIRRLGGVPELHQIFDGPLISVVVRTKDRPELLAEALASVTAGSYRRVEVVVVNDGGEPPTLPEDSPFPIIVINLPQNLGRAAAANAGVENASGSWITFLDDDDLMEPEHLATLAGLVAAAGVRVAYTDAAVGIYELDPESGWRESERRLPYSRDFDPEFLLFDNYIPFNTLLFERALLLEAGPFDTDLPFFEDWDMLIRLSQLSSFFHLPKVTAEYRHFRGNAHHIFGERPGDRPDFMTKKAQVIERHRNLHTPEILARVFSNMRAETVEAKEAESAREAELAEVKQRFTEERETLLAARDVLAIDLEKHRKVVSENEENIQRLYSEISRLGEIIKAMENTKAWRFHRRFEALRGK